MSSKRRRIASQQGIINMKTCNAMIYLAIFDFPPSGNGQFINRDTRIYSDSILSNNTETAPN